MSSGAADEAAVSTDEPTDLQTGESIVQVDTEDPTTIAPIEEQSDMSAAPETGVEIGATNAVAQAVAGAVAGAIARTDVPALQNIVSTDAVDSETVVNNKERKPEKKKDKKKMKKKKPEEEVFPDDDEQTALMQTILELGGEGYGTIDNSEASAKDDKKTKKARKMIQDMLKIDMASERTFFKWFRTGLQIGAIGTFVFIALDKQQDSPWRFAVVAFAWFMALLLILYGLYSYYQRRAAIRTGAIDEMSDFMRDHSPVLVVASLILVVSAGLAYALLTGQEPTKPKMPYYPGPPAVPYPRNATAVRDVERVRQSAPVAVAVIGGVF